MRRSCHETSYGDLANEAPYRDLAKRTVPDSSELLQGFQTDILYRDVIIIIVIIVIIMIILIIIVFVFTFLSTHCLESLARNHSSGYRSRGSGDSPGEMLVSFGAAPSRV